MLLSYMRQSGFLKSPIHIPLSKLLLNSIIFVRFCTYINLCLFLQ